ncbi:hypothetical protein [Nonomuraea sp. NPDC049625]|uniref:hypothetical protein n=1 Tax=Nonomuraea sp. NPDC049625 TaxID=3155775 RepID=UPI00342C1AE8
MPDPPAIKILPDSAGYLLKRRTHADGRQEVLVSWVAITPGPRGGLHPREEWLPLDQVELIAGVDYRVVEHQQFIEDRAAQAAPPGQAAAAGRPAGWPAQVPLPADDPDWATQAMAFLLDFLPADF